MKPYIRLTPKKEKMKSIGWAAWPFLAIREDYKDDILTLEHEEFHLWQQISVGIILFYPLWLLFTYKTHGYKDNPFEVASREHAKDPTKHNPYSWIKFLKKQNNKINENKR